MESKKVKTFKFNKIDFYGKGRKINQPEITLILEYNDDEKPCLRISGSVWNSRHSDIIAGGQCLDEMAKYESLINDSTFNILFYLWKNYHLNDCRCGGPLQEATLKDCKSSSYEERCSYLESKGLLYEDDIKYGTTWWYHEIPEDDMNTINKLLNS